MAELSPMNTGSFPHFGRPCRMASAIASAGTKYSFAAICWARPTRWRDHQVVFVSESIPQVIGAAASRIERYLPSRAVGELGAR